jgi:acyl carrier protein
MIHDAIEREFSIDIDDRKILLTSIEEAFDFILSDHKAV